MKLDASTFVRLRRLAPVLDDVSSAGEVEHTDQPVDLSSLAQYCSQLFDAYYDQLPVEIAQAQSRTARFSDRQYNLADIKQYPHRCGKNLQVIRR